MQEAALAIRQPLVIGKNGRNAGMTSYGLSRTGLKDEKASHDEGSIRIEKVWLPKATEDDWNHLPIPLSGFLHVVSHLPNAEADEPCQSLSFLNMFKLRSLFHASPSAR